MPSRPAGRSPAIPRAGAGAEIYEEQAILHGPDGEEGWYVRANVEIPISGSSDKLVFTVWVTQSEANFERAMEQWDNPARVDDPPTFGWLAAQLPGYGSDDHLKTHVHQRPPGERPWVELEPTDHPLAVDQRKGIDRTRLVELAALAAHPSESQATPTIAARSTRRTSSRPPSLTFGSPVAPQLRVQSSASL